MRSKRAEGRKRMRTVLPFLCMVCICVMLSACGKKHADGTPQQSGGKMSESTPTAKTNDAITKDPEQPSDSTGIPTESPVPTSEPILTATLIPEPTLTPAPTQTPTTTPVPTPVPETGKLVVIDAGHQRKGNNDKEPDGSGSATMKAKVSSGTEGRYTGIPEYELNLIVAQKLEAILKERGYRVIMVRDTHDVDLSNSERAEIANRAGADAFIRIHANAHDNSAVNGAETLCQTKNNPYNADLYKESRRLSEEVLNALCAECGCKKRSVVETDTMSGINWCRVPVTIVEMGFMTNETEDRLMATEEYRNKLAKGIADGIDAYFAE